MIQKILNEKHRAQMLHPHWPDDILHQMAIVGEEYGEAVRAAVQYVYEGGDKEEVRKELIQTCATILRLLEHDT